MRFVNLILILPLLGLTLSFMPGCAGRGPERVLLEPSAAYFTVVEKPRLRSDLLRDVTLWANELSESWDGLYMDRLKARAEIEEMRRKAR